jgi:putative lipoprotein
MDRCLSVVVKATLMLAVVLHGSTARAQGTDRWFGRDKALHFAAGASFAAAGYAGTALVSDGRKPRIAVGVSVGVGANAAKEFRDRRSKGDPSWKDFAVGAIGSVVGTSVAWLIDRR